MSDDALVSAPELARELAIDDGRRQISAYLPGLERRDAPPSSAPQGEN